SLWIRENHAEVVQALGRYHAWICVRIRAIQKSIFPYIIGDVAHQTGIPARTHALLASAAGSSRPILLAAEASTAFATAPGAEDQPTPAGVVNSTLPAVGFHHPLGTRGGFRAVRPVPAPQAVKAIRPPTVPGLSLRYLKQSRKPNPAAKTALPAPSPNHPAAVSITLRTAHVSKRAKAHQAAKPDEPTLAPNTRSTSASPTDNHAQQHSDSDARAQSTLYEQSKPSSEPTPGLVPARHAPSSSPATATAQSTLHERTKPTLVPTPGPVPERHAPSSSPATDPAKFTLPERTKPIRPPVAHHLATAPRPPIGHPAQTRGP
ncbi:MAG: hypothetical protein J0H49_36930, partial [Acidobacteria bacterium]|nr:hypothetical protein [Acidobacteriota bacterium]